MNVEPPTAKNARTASLLKILPLQNVNRLTAVALLCLEVHHKSMSPKDQKLRVPWEKEKIVPMSLNLAQWAITAIKHQVPCAMNVPVVGHRSKVPLNVILAVKENFLHKQVLPVNRVL